MALKLSFQSNDTEQAQLSLDPKNFKTGSTGFWAGGKVLLHGYRYQVSCSVVKVCSKPITQADAT